MTSKRTLVHRYVKEKVWLRDNYRCHYCGKDLKSFLNVRGDYSEITIDHVIAKINGGTNEQSNLVTSCHGCNNQKSKLEQPLIRNK